MKPLTLSWEPRPREGIYSWIMKGMVEATRANSWFLPALKRRTVPVLVFAALYL